MPVFVPGPDDQRLALEIALEQAAVLGHELRHDRRDDLGVDVGESDPAQAEQVVDRRRELVTGRLAVGREPPVLDELGAVEGADVGLGVADVDREQHRVDYACQASERDPARLAAWGRARPVPRPASYRRLSVSPGASSSERREHEAPVGELRVRDHEVVLGHREVAR